MEKLIHCHKYGEKLEALKEAPLIGPIGQIIGKNVSQKAWDEWVEVEIKIINEERLDLSEASAQERLYSAMIEFLNLGDLIAL